MFKKIIYYIDNSFSKGSLTLTWILLFVTTSTIILTSFLIWLTNLSTDPTFIGNIWTNTITILTGNTSFDQQWHQNIYSLILMIIGLILTSTLIGILSAGIHIKFSELSKGKTIVIEKNHTVILGWSPYIYRVISEICEANRNQVQSCIVILSSEYDNRVDMERRIKFKASFIGKTKIICRIGSSYDLDDISKTSPHTAKSIIILNNQKNNDHNTIRTLLALTNNNQKSIDDYNIVAHIEEEKNLSIKNLISKNGINLIHSETILSRILVQACRDPGLSEIYMDLLDFSGDEIYFSSEPSLIGKKFHEILFSFEKSIVIGIYNSMEKHSILSPDFNYKIQSHDQIILISEDDSTIEIVNNNIIKTDLIVQESKNKQEPDNILILGYNNLIPKIVKGLDNYSAKGSSITIIDSESIDEINKKSIQTTINQKVIFKNGEISSRDFLNSINYSQYSHVIILPQMNFNDIEEADSKILLILLYLKEIIKTKNYGFKISTQINSSKNKALINISNVSDFVVSGHIISLLQTQISENKMLGPIFEDLFTETGVQVHFKSIIDYVKIDEEVNFYTITQSAINKNEIAIGYKHKNTIILNPNKSKKIIFNEHDKIILLTK